MRRLFSSTKRRFNLLHKNCIAKVGLTIYLARARLGSCCDAFLSSHDTYLTWFIAISYEKSERKMLLCMLIKALFFIDSKEHFILIQLLNFISSSLFYKTSNFMNDLNW